MSDDQLTNQVFDAISSAGEPITVSQLSAKTRLIIDSVVFAVALLLQSQKIKVHLDQAADASRDEAPELEVELPTVEERKLQTA